MLFLGTGILTLVGIAVAMLVISKEYTLLSLAIAPLLLLIVSGYTSGWCERLAEARDR